MPTILDPTDERKPIDRQLAPRPEKFDRPIGLLDISKPRGDVFLDRIEAQLRERTPSVEIRRYRKPTFTKPAPAELLRQLRDECGFVIEALAD